MRVGGAKRRRTSWSSDDMGDGEPISREGSKGGSELSPFEVDWLDFEVVKVVSVYTSSSIQSFVDRVDILNASLPDNVFSLRRSLPTDRVFHGRGFSSVDFFFLYAKVVKDSRLRLPFNEFSMEVLRVLNVAPT